MRRLLHPLSAVRARTGRRAVAAACLALFLVPGLLGGCQGDESRLAEHMQRAEEYREAEQWEEAILEYRSALQIAPNDADAHWGLARAYLNAQRVREGYWELRETARLDPGNTEARLRFGQLSLLAGALDEAVEQADAVIEADPSNAEAYLLRGRALEGLDETETARAAYEAALEAAPDNPAALLVLGSFHQRHDDPEEAERLFTRLAETDPSYLSHTALARFYAGARDRDADAEAAYRRAVEAAEPGELAGAYRGLAGFYYSRDRFDEAEATVQEGIERSDEGKLELIYLLAQFYRARGDKQRADAMIEEATRARPDDVRPYLILSSYRGQQGDLDGALAAAESAVDVSPENRQARLRKAEVLVDLGYRRGEHDRITQGRAIVDAVLAVEPSSPEALFVKGKLELADGDIEAAVTALRQAIDARPEWAQAHFVLGSALLLRGDTSTARAELAQALELDPALSDGRRLLAQVHARLGEHEYAVEEGERYLRERPDDRKTTVLVAQSLVRLGRSDEARARLEAVPEEERDAELWYALGRIAFAEGRLDDAWDLLLRADEIEPGHANILRSMLGVERARTGGGLTETAKRIRTAVETSPDDAKLVQLDATLALLEGNASRAEERYRRAIELDPKDVSSYDELARVYVLTGRRAQTIETYEQALKEQPDSARLHHLLGVLYESDARPEQAREHYEAAIALDANQAESKNNLAYMLAESGEDLDRALDLAQEAKSLLPDNPNAADTLGWVLYKRGVPSAAIGYLLEAENGMPPGDAAVAIVRHHLALAYEASGQSAEALAALDRALTGLERQLEAARAAGREVEEPAWAAELRSMRERLSAATPPAGNAG